MDSDSDLIGTLFTFLMFILIIILPMAMAFLQARKDRRAGNMHKKSPAARSAGGLFSSIDLLRRQERESEPEVSFSEGIKQRPGSGAKGPRPSETETSQQLGEKFAPIEAMSNDFGRPLSNITEAPAGSAGAEERAALPRTAAVSRLRELNEMQRAILLSEILGPPKGLE